MKNRLVARYYGTQDTLQVSALVLDDSGTESIHKQLKTGTFRLQQNEVDIMRIVVGPDDYNTGKQGFYVFFIHPPVQHHLYVTFDVELYNGEVSSSRRSVSLTQPSEPYDGTNPVIPMRPGKDYANSWDADGRSRNPD